MMGLYRKIKTYILICWPRPNLIISSMIPSGAGVRGALEWGDYGPKMVIKVQKNK